jgi:hypothetical protein
MVCNVMSHRAFDGYTAPQTANGVNGSQTVIRAQSATGTNANGGDLILASGKGTNNDGYVRIGTDGYDRLIITPVGISTTLSQIAFDGYQVSPLITQLDMPTNGIDGYSLTIKSQRSLVSPAHGGNLILQGGDGYDGDGYFRDGYVRLLSGLTEGARIVHNKIFFLAGQRINVANIGTTPFNVPDGYFTMLVDTSSIAITINLPSNPVIGDTYQIKDATGNAGTHTITVSGNGHNIDGSSTQTIISVYGNILVVYGGTQWSVL